MTLSGKIDRIDVDPGSARGIVAGLQVGPHRPLRGGDREGAPAPDPALHARSARPRRDRAARRPLPAARGRAARARPAPRRGEGGRASGLRQDATTWTRRRSGGRSTLPVTSPAGLRSGSAPATFATTRREATVAPRGAISGACAASGEHEGAERTAGGRDRGGGAGLRLGRAPAPGRRRCSSSASPRRCVERGPRHRVDARHHLHRADGG